MRAVSHTSLPAKGEREVGQRERVRSGPSSFLRPRDDGNSVSVQPVPAKNACLTQAPKC